MPYPPFAGVDDAELSTAEPVGPVLSPPHALSVAATKTAITNACSSLLSSGTKLFMTNSNEGVTDELFIAIEENAGAHGSACCFQAMRETEGALGARHGRNPFMMASLEADKRRRVLRGLLVDSLRP